MSDHAPLSPDWFTHHRERLHHWRPDRLDLVLADLAVMQDEIQELLQANRHLPATITITATQNGHTMGTYNPNAPVLLTAKGANTEGTQVATQFSWTTTGGTLTPADDTQTATLTGASLGDVTITATATNGVTGEDVVTFADQTVTTVTVTDAAA